MKSPASMYFVYSIQLLFASSTTVCNLQCLCCELFTEACFNEPILRFYG